MTPMLNQALKAYAAAPQPVPSAGAGARNNLPAQGKDFATFVQDAAQEGLDVMQTSERMSVAGIEGKASAQAVVEAVAAAEVTLHTVTAVRDKLVEAYQDIMRMPV